MKPQGFQKQSTVVQAPNPFKVRPAHDATQEATSSVSGPPEPSSNAGSEPHTTQQSTDAQHVVYGAQQHELAAAAHDPLLLLAAAVIQVQLLNEVKHSIICLLFS